MSDTTTVMDERRATTLPPDAEIVLSRRNLLSLLVKLEQPWSQRTIHVPFGDNFAIVRAVTDEEKYADRDFPPGSMHPETEELLDRVMAALYV